MNKSKLCVLAFLSLLCAAAIFCSCNPTETPLDTPQNLVLSEDEILSWDAVEGAEYYVVTVGEVEYETTETEMDLFEILITPGEVAISVTAYPADFVFQSESAQIVHTVREPSGIALALNSAGTGYMVKAENKDSVSGKLIIPDTYNGLPVTEIVQDAFSGCEKITGVYISDSVRLVKGAAFVNCTSLTRFRWSPNTTQLVKATFPYGLKVFLASGFLGCDGLREIELPSFGYFKPYCGCTIFSGCSDSLEKFGVVAYDSLCPNIEAISVEEGLKYKSDNNCVIDIEKNSVVFGTCKAIIPEYVTCIEYSAFTQINIEKINIPENVKTIECNAFYGCEKLTEVVISKGTSSIFGGAFRKCANIASVTVDSQNPVYKSDGNCIITKADNVLVVGFNNSVIPYYITEIGESAFAETDIKSVVIPLGCEKIGNCAFLSCKSLKEAQLPEGLKIIGPSAFAYSALSSVVIPYGCEEIGERAFDRCGALKEVKIPNTVKTIGRGAFAYNHFLNVVIPESVTTIEAEAFYLTHIATLYTSFETMPEGWDEKMCYEDTGYNTIGESTTLVGIVFGCEICYDEDGYPYLAEQQNDA